MRISSNPSDSGYTIHSHLCRFWLAGAERNNVETADDTARFAITLARDEFGEPRRDKDGNQLRERFYGDVRIDAPPWLRSQQDSRNTDDEGLGALGAVIFAMSQTP